MLDIIDVLDRSSIIKDGKGKGLLEVILKSHFKNF